MNAIVVKNHHSLIHTTRALGGRQFMVDSAHKRHIIGKSNPLLRRPSPHSIAFGTTTSSFASRPMPPANRAVLGTTDVESAVSGLSSFYFTVPTVDVSDIKPGTLTNCGLLTASLRADGEDVLDVNMVVVVTKEAAGLTRTIYSPLDS